MNNGLTRKLENRKEMIKRMAKHPDFYLFLFLVGVFLFAYSTVKLDPLSDDGCYRVIIADHPGFLNYLSFTYHYLNGRAVANTLMYVMLQLDFMPLWVLISTAATLSIAYNLSRTFGIRPTLQSTNLALGLILCFGFRVLSSSMLWFTGAIFYLWPISVTVYLLARLSDRYHSGTRLTFGWRACLELILGVAVTFWGEQFALVLIGFWLCYLASVLFQKKQKPSRVECLMTLALIAGFLTMFFAPSQALRMTNVYGYESYKGGVGYLLANGLYWTFQSVFVHQKVLVLLFGVLTLLCIDRSRHRVLVYTFAALLCVSVMLALLQSIPLAWCFELSKPLYQILYLPDAAHALSALIPYLFWTVYTTLLLTIFLMNTKRKRFTGLVLLASVATLVVMWFSTTMYASANRTCAVFCFGMALLMLKFLTEHKCNCTYIILGTGLCNVTLLLVRLLRQFVIFY